MVSLAAFAEGLRGAFTGVELKETYNEEKNGIALISNVQLKIYDDDILLRIVCFDNGVLYCFAVFDKIDRTDEAYELINKFNSKQSLISAYIQEINGGEFLEIRYNVLECESTINAIVNAKKFLDILVENNTKELLLPLTKLTHK